jgi:hypothetical protein
VKKSKQGKRRVQCPACPRYFTRPDLDSHMQSCMFANRKSELVAALLAAEATQTCPLCAILLHGSAPHRHVVDCVIASVPAERRRTNSFDRDFRLSLRLQYLLDDDERERKFEAAREAARSASKAARAEWRRKETERRLAEPEGRLVQDETLRTATEVQHEDERLMSCPSAQPPDVPALPAPSEPSIVHASPVLFENIVRFLLRKSFRTTRVPHSELLFLVESLQHPWSVVVAFGARSSVVQSLPIAEMAQEAKVLRARVVCRLFRLTNGQESRRRIADFDYVSGRLTDHGWTVKDPDRERRDALRSAIAFWGQETIWRTLASLQNATWCKRDLLYTTRVATDFSYARTGHFIEFRSLRGIPKTCCAVVWMDRH